MRDMRQLWLVIPLVGLLVGALYYAYDTWVSIEGAPMPGYGYAALAGGVIFSLIFGCGLMALMFYSHNNGYDEAGEAKRRVKGD
jgi:hypothetical protein